MGKDGFRYSYQAPGFNKVMQAAGRVIRSEQDRGVVVLVDSRFMNPVYRLFFPAEWSGFVGVKNLHGLRTCLDKFWNQQ
jgi:Rad3-related DNA helicase